MSRPSCSLIPGQYSTLVEHLLEYQDYVLAYRLKLQVGGSLRPEQGLLSLAAYANKRLQRQQLAAALVGSGEYVKRLPAIESLTEELNFGFWHNPSETLVVLRRIVERGGCKAIEDETQFIHGLLTEAERSKLSLDEQHRVAAYYLGLLRASAAHLDAEVFTRLRAEVEPLRATLSVFVL